MDPAWTPTGNQNWSGAPEFAANMYSQIYGRTIVSVRGPGAGPLSFLQIKEKICPADGSLGTPYIWAYENDDLGNLHDVVVMGYSITLGRSRKTLLNVHDPNYPLEPNLYEYDWYDDSWNEEVMISKIR
jgi:hypothetical protein